MPSYFVDSLQQDTSIVCLNIPACKVNVVLVSV